jgi:hypothetical protein
VLVVIQVEEIAIFADDADTSIFDYWYMQKAGSVLFNQFTEESVIYSQNDIVYSLRVESNDTSLDTNFITLTRYNEQLLVSWYTSDIRAEAVIEIFVVGSLVNTQGTEYSNSIQLTLNAHVPSCFDTTEAITLIVPM